VAAQLTEARKSTETAISVARLTKLAFIFIPLNFVTSFYGMNMKQFGSGNVSLWIFFATALAPIIGTLLPFVSEPFSAEIMISAVRMALISPPSTAFWFFAFTLFHSSDTNQKTL
jgi:hypothetical protein